MRAWLRQSAKWPVVRRCAAALPQMDRVQVLVQLCRVSGEAS